MVPSPSHITLPHSSRLRSSKSKPQYLPYPSPASSVSADELKLGSDQKSRETKNSGSIPKPKGEAGRPRCGGYTLKKALGWPKSKYELVRKVLKELNRSFSFTEQSTNALQLICIAAVQKYSWLDRFEGLWAIDDIIRSILKYQKEIGRRVEARELEAWYNTDKDRAASVASDAFSSYTSDSTRAPSARNKSSSPLEPPNRDLDSQLPETLQTDKELEEEILVELKGSDGKSPERQRTMMSKR
ncbi:hypothetical protein V5O48_009299 [Marasmius crinis-equi]|uniref:Uncharacterized protein n=1 Tax=Marasmius crinis-equi TaxID=585013 RepID=A0ABR3FBH3_9AGAR